MSADLVELLKAEIEARRGAIEELAARDDARLLILEMSVNVPLRNVTLRWHPVPIALGTTEAR